MAERRVLRRASHQSLKVPVFRDQSFTELSQNTPADSYVRGDWDADYRRDDWDDDDADTGPLATIRESPQTEPAGMEGVSWDEASSRPLPSNGLTFKPASRPWYGSSRALLFALGIAVVAMIVAAVLLVLRYAGDDAQESTTVTQPASTSASPTTVPTSNPVGEDPLPPAELPPPPPPPPPPDEANPAPPGTGGGYRWYPPSQSDTPTGRPREPAPISVAPQPHEAPSPGHTEPGDAPKRRRGFFG